jgi:hypothetical protein
VAKLNKLTVGERYDGPRDGCKLWPIMEIVDENGTGTGKGYTDSTFGTCVEDKDNVKAQYPASIRDMTVKIGERYSNEIGVDNYGAYTVNNPKIPVHVVQRTEEPGRAEIDDEEDLDGHTYKWNVGDYQCCAACLKKLEDGRNLYSRDDTRRLCVVYLYKVVNATLDMRPFTNQSGDTPLPPKVSITTARRDGA